MKLSVADLEVEIKQIGKLRNIHKDQRFLEFIAKKCIEVLKEETENKRSLTWDKKMNDEYVEGHRYETFINGLSSIILLENVATNQFGEYISRYIEYGTGMFNAESTAPEGWYYPTDAEDRNPTKEEIGGNYVAWTRGQLPKYVYEDALEKIKDKMNGWIEEYISREVKL